MIYGRERRGVSEKRFGESFFAGKEGNRGKNTEQGFAAVIVFVPRERVDFFDTLKAPAVLRLPELCCHTDNGFENSLHNQR